MPPTRKHLNIDISDKLDALIARTCREHGVSRTQAVARLASIGRYILDHQEKGGSIMVRHKNGDRDVVRFEF